MTALMLASYKGRVEIVKLLLNYGAQVDIKDNKNGWTALTHASINGHIDILKILLDHGAQVDVKDKVGSTAYMHAKYGDYTQPDCAKLLLDHGAVPERTKWLLIKPLPDEFW